MIPFVAFVRRFCFFEREMLTSDPCKGFRWHGTVARGQFFFGLGDGPSRVCLFLFDSGTA